MNYSDWINEVAVLMPQPLATPFSATAPFLNPDYNVLIPRAVEFAELKMYRDPDLNFLAASKIDSSGALTTGSRTFTVPGGFIIVEQLAAIVPFGSASPATGDRIQFQPTTLEFINQAWPRESVTSTPSVNGPGPWFAMRDPTTAIVAPTPNANYTVEVTGTFRPAALSDTNTTTYLTNFLPDLFTAASMIFWTGVMKDYGAQADDPRMALSWDAVYDKQKRGAAVEAARQRAQGQGWTDSPPTTVASPPVN